MNTTITTGGVNYSYQTSKPRFTKGETQLENAQAAGAEETFTFSGNAPQPTEAPTRLRDMDGQTRSQLRDLTKQLAGDGRLFIRDEQGLRRANPAEIKERLDKGQPIEIVTAEASEQSASGSAYSSCDFKQRGIFTQGYNISDSSRRNQSSTRVFYSSSEIREWDSLEWADDAPGVKGVSRLPASGGSVVVSSNYEHEWSARAEKEWGVFTHKSDVSGGSGYTRVSRRAD